METVGIRRFRRGSLLPHCLIQPGAYSPVTRIAADGSTYMTLPVSSEANRSGSPSRWPNSWTTSIANSGHAVKPSYASVGHTPGLIQITQWVKGCAAVSTFSSVPSADIQPADILTLPPADVGAASGDSSRRMEIWPLHGIVCQ